jgi:ABC-type glycerol-3-phosphate transport system permease component
MLLNLCLLTAGIIFIFPLVWVFFTSFKTDAEIVRATPTFLPETWTLDNYLGLPSRAPFLRFFFNSV